MFKVPPVLYCNASQGALFHYSNLSGINVSPNPPCLHSTPEWLHSGQFSFCSVDIRGLRSCLFRCIRIGNSILCQSLLSSQHRRTVHICIQTRAEGDCISVGGRACIHTQSHPLPIALSSSCLLFSCLIFLFLLLCPIFCQFFFLFSHFFSCRWWTVSSWSPRGSLVLLFQLPPCHPSTLLRSDGANL